MKSLNKIESVDRQPTKISRSGPVLARILFTSGVILQLTGCSGNVEAQEKPEKAEVRSQDFWTSLEVAEWYIKELEGVLKDSMTAEQQQKMELYKQTLQSAIAIAHTIRNANAQHTTKTQKTDRDQNNRELHMPRTRKGVIEFWLYNIFQKVGNAETIYNEIVQKQMVREIMGEEPSPNAIKIDDENGQKLHQLFIEMTEQWEELCEAL